MRGPTCFSDNAACIVRKVALIGSDVDYVEVMIFSHSLRVVLNGEGRNRTGDTTIFSRVLYQLSYLAEGPWILPRARLSFAKLPRSMRQLPRKTTFLGVACASLLALGGCGGAEGDDAASPLDNALGYLPEDAPLVASIDTNVKGNQYESIGKIVDKFPFGESVRSALKEVVEDEGGDYEDIEPLLGNEFVVGASSARALRGDGGDDDFVGAVQAKNKDKLEETVKADKPKEDGEKNGAKLYKDDDGDSFAVKDDVLIVAGSKRLLEAALEQRDADDRLTEDTFDEATNDLPADALLRVSGDLQKLLASDPETQDARKVKWVSALRTFGATVSFKDDEANVGFRLRTDSGTLTEKDLPLAAGAASPSIVDRAGEVAAGIKDPTQIVDFAEKAGQAIDPSGYGDYAQAKRTIERQLDLDIENDLLDQLEGDLSITFAVNGKFGARSEVKDPRRFDRTLAKLGKVLPDVAESATGGSVGYAKPKKGGDFYALATADGDSVVYGVVDRVFVLANDPRTAGQLSAEETEPVSGSKGSVVVNADAAQLVQQILGQLGGAGLAGAAVTGPLGDLTGSMSSETSGITGNFTLNFK